MQIPFEPREPPHQALSVECAPVTVVTRGTLLRKTNPIFVADVLSLKI